MVASTRHIGRIVLESGSWPMTHVRRIAVASLFLIDAAKAARVIVDGVEDSVGDFNERAQLLELRPGAHRIAIEAEGYAPQAFDVRVGEYGVIRRVVKLRALRP